ncbi:MAG TPA: hypothetical protein DHW45_18285 [Candidatus Latescibacteria bacterium]|nr:hypothetical protein [Candidatus Latescibacterota bacterium]
MSSGLRRHAGCFLILTAFTLLYGWGNGYFVRSSIWQHDEYMVLNSAGLMYATGNWFPRQTSGIPPAGRHQNWMTMLGPPHAFHHVYITAVHAYYLAGKALGIYEAPMDLVGSDPWTVYTLGRTLVLLCSIGALAMTYRIGLLVFGSRAVGLIAMVMMGLSEYYLFMSKLCKVDVPMIFFATISMWFLLRASDTGRMRHYAWAGLFCGIAAGSKLPATYLVLVICFTYVLTAIRGTDSWHPKRLILAGVASIVGVFGTNPNLAIYFDDLFWAIEEFEKSLKAQGGIVEPWYYYYTNPESYVYLVRTTFAGMYAGLYPALLSVAGFGLILAKRDTKALILVSFPLLYIATNFPMLVSQIYREYHVCIFVMALATGYAIRWVYKKTIETAFPKRVYRVVGLSVLVLLLMRDHIAHANAYAFYATQPSNYWIAYEWIEQHIPRGTKFVQSHATGIDSEKTGASWQPYGSGNKNWKETLAVDFDYALFKPSLASGLSAYCPGNARLVREFPALAKGHERILLYKLKSDTAEPEPPPAYPREVLLHLEGTDPVVKAVISRDIPVARPQTLLVWASDLAVRVSLPPDVDVVYFRLPGTYHGEKVRAMLTVLPVELKTGHQVAGIELIHGGSEQVATQYLLTDGQRVTTQWPNSPDLLHVAEKNEMSKTTIRSPLRHLTRHPQVEGIELALLAPPPVTAETPVLEVPREGDLSKIEITVSMDGHDEVVKNAAIRISQVSDPAALPRRVSFVKLALLHPDGTAGSVGYQVAGTHKSGLVIPPVGLREGTVVRMTFEMGPDR